MSGWYPGHMLKARREMKTHLQMVDVVIEIVDARIPISSRIPDLASLIFPKPCVVALNKADLADATASRVWVAELEQAGLFACTVNSVTGDGTKRLLSLARWAASETRTGGRRFRPFRAMAVGIPNVGKSSLLNRFAGSKSVRTGNRPGVTRGRQWLSVASDLELLDLPGILWPDQSEGRTFFMLSVTGSIPEGGFSQIEVARDLFSMLRLSSPRLLSERYGEIKPDAEPDSFLEQIGMRRGFLISGGEVDTTKAARALLLDFQSGKLGRHTLELPEDMIEGESDEHP